MLSITIWKNASIVKRMGICLVAIGFLPACISKLPEEKATTLPNVIIIYADDIAYNDLGVYGTDMIPTPNLDEMARTGMQLNS